MSTHSLGAAPPFQTQFHLPALPSLKTTPTPPQLSLTQTRKPRHAIRAVSIDQIPPNALRRKRDSNWRGGFSVGVDLGLSRTGLALSKGFSVRPLTVLNLRGQKLEVQLLEIAKQQEADEFIIGLPRWSDGKETPQSNKVRSVAGRLAASAAERGWRVYLQDENGTSIEAMDRMINIWCWSDIFPCQVKVLSLYCPRIWICKKDLQEVHRKMLIISLKTMRIDYSHCNCQTPSLFMSLVYSFKRSLYNGEVAII